MNPKVVWTKWAVDKEPGYRHPYGGFRTARQAKAWAKAWNGSFIVRCRGPQSALWATRLYVQQAKLG